MRLFLLLFASASLLFGDVFRLYLKTGEYHLVREYQVQGGRVRYYSTERGDWEEIPVSLVDLDKTEAERKSKAETTTRETRQEDEEEQARRALRHEIESVPMETGAYYNLEGQVKQLDAAPYQVITNKKRQTLKLISPIPLIPGKAAVVIQGEHSKFVVHDNRPTFYFRPEREERFGIVRVTPRKNVREVENISIVPKVNEGFQNRQEIPVFQQQLESNLYKVWPEKPMEPGEYAVVEFDDNGESEEIQLLVWDFAYQPGAPPTAASRSK